MTPDTKTEEPAATALPVPTDAEARTIFSKLKVTNEQLNFQVPVFPFFLL